MVMTSNLSNKSACASLISHRMQVTHLTLCIYVALCTGGTGGSGNDGVYETEVP